MAAPKLRFKNDNGQNYPEWKVKQLKELCSVITKGTTPKLYSNGDDDINFIKIESVKNGRVDVSQCAKIANITHKTELKRSILCDGDILFAIAGSLGVVAKIDAGILPANTNQAFAIIRLINKAYRN